MKLIYRVSPKQRLIFADGAVKQLLAFRQCTWWQAEAGGVLLGRHLLDMDDIVVDEITTPQKSDQRRRFNFFRSKQHEVLARTRWNEQASTMAYLGLWHTHPEVDPVPSCVDRLDWENAVSRDTFEGNRLFFPIVGTERIRIWALTRDGEFHELLEEKIKND